MNLEEKTQSCMDKDATIVEVDVATELDKDVTEQEEARLLDILHCPTCFRTFHDGSRAYFERHLETCGKGTLPCSVCNKKFCSIRVLRKHTANVHLKSNSLKCEICSQVFTTKFNFKRHLERAHGSKDTEVHNCLYCAKQFKWKSSLSRHVIEKHCFSETLAFECRCGQKFPNYHQSYIHKKGCDEYNKHKAENEIKVEQCLVSEDIDIHEKRSLENENGNMPKSCSGMLDLAKTNADSLKIKEIGGSHHKCQFCNKIFIERQMLEDHVDKCDPFDNAVGSLYSHVGKIGKQVDNSSAEKFSDKEAKCHKETELTEKELGTAREEAGQNIADTYNTKRNPAKVIIVVACLDEKSRKGSKDELVSSKQQKDSSADNIIRNVSPSKQKATKKIVKGKQNSDSDLHIDSNLCDLDDPDFVVNEASSGNTIYRSRSGRKRKLKVFEDCESDYLDSLTQTKRRHVKSSDNVSDQTITVKSGDVNPVLQDANIKSGSQKKAENFQVKTSKRKSISVTFLCPLCDHTEEVLETIQHHIKSNHDQKRLSWSVLSSNYKKMQGIDKDPASSVKHGDSRCSSCKVDGFSTKELKLHMNKHHAYFPFCCGICRLAHHTIEAAKVHMKKIHVQGYACLHCPKSFQREKTLIQHNNKWHKGEVCLTESDGIELQSEKGKDEHFISSTNKSAEGAVCEVVVKQESVLSGQSKDSSKIVTMNGKKSVKVNQANCCGPSKMSEKRAENSNITKNMENRNSVCKGKLNVDKETLKVPEQQHEEQQVNQKETTAHRNESVVLSPAVIKSVKIVPRKRFSEVIKSVNVVDEKETESIRNTEHQETNDKTDETDTVDADAEYVDFDANLSDTDEDVGEDDEHLKQSELKYKQKKKMALKQQKTHSLFDYSKLRDAVFECSFENCGTVLPSFNLWQNHLAKHIKKKRRPPFSCMECSYSTQDKKILNQHLVIKHNNLSTVEITLKYCQVLQKDSATPVKVIACVFCGFLSDLQHFSSQHECYRKKLNFYCPFCSKKDFVFESLQDHIKEEHSEKTVHRQKMGNKYQTLRTSQLDPASSIDAFEKRCEKCGLKFEANGELKIHVNEKHAIFPYSCGVCRQCYGRRTAVMEHMKKTHSLPLVCQYCERGFGDKNDLSRHEASHQKTKPFKCDLCDSRYADQKGLRFHYRQKHPEKTEGVINVQRVDDDLESELFMCDICGLSFDTHSKYKMHAQTHKDNDAEDSPKVNCEICAKEFTRKAYNKHMCTKMLEGNGPVVIEGYRDTVQSIQDIYQRIRQSPAPGSGAKVRCGLCNRDFKKNSYLFTHIRQVHLPNEGKKLRCSICRSGFTTKAQLISHMRSHSKVKPYKCRICSKSYRQLGHIKVHLLSHSKTHNFKCKLCSQAFKAKPSLANHVLTHCDIFPYKCFVVSCQKQFNSLQNLLVHVRLCAPTSRNADEFECKICSNKIDTIKDGLSHMRNHGNDLLYKCNECNQDFLSYRKLYKHKAELDHFSQAELESAAGKVSCVQKFRSVEVEEDAETLQKLYEYTQEDFVLEDNNSEIENDEEHEVEFSDAEETEVSNVIETDELMDIAEQLTHMASRGGKNFALEEDQTDLPVYSANVFQGTSGTVHPSVLARNSTTNEPLNESFFAMDGNAYLNETMIDKHDAEGTEYIISQTGSIKKPELNQPHRERPHLSAQSADFLTTEEDKFQVKILESHPIIDENAVIVSKDSQPRKQLKNNLEKIIDVQDEIQNTTVEMHYDDQIGTNVVSEEMLASSKIFDEFGKEVKVNVVNDQGYHVPIQSNPELLQTLLSTGKYTLQFDHHQESNMEDYSKTIPDLEENTTDVSETEILPKVNNAMEFENLDFSFQGGADIYVINEVLPVDEYKYPASIDDGDKTEEKKKRLKADNGPKKKTLMNTDKVFGEIIDKDAEINNCKMEDGQINYKVRLNYYEDRTKHEDQYPLKCDVCPYRFKRMKDLNIHKKKHLPDNAKPFQCKECGKGFSTRHSFAAHMLTHTGERPHKCPQCDKRFRQLGHLQTHLRGHADYRPFKCMHCNKTFITNSQLKQHVKTHGTHFTRTFENGVTCTVCGNVFANEKDLGTHRLKHLSTSTKNELLAEFNSLLPDKSREIKERKVQLAVPGHMCDVCGKMFNRPSDLNDHKEVHFSGPKISCKECGNQFISERRLQSHTNNVHSAERWQCDTCGVQLKSKLSFKFHMRSHKEPKFQCARCKKKFVRKVTFVQHLSSCFGDDFVQKIQNLTDQVSSTGSA